MSEDQPKNDDEVTKADVEASVLRYLSRRDHAIGELRRKLRKKDYPDDLIEEVIDDYRRYGYLDDARFALLQAEILIRKEWGPRQITKKLRKRGVDQTIIDEAVAELEEQIDWADTCRQRLHSRFGAPEELSDKEQQKAYRHLVYRGFSPNLIRRILWDER